MSVRPSHIDAFREFSNAELVLLLDATNASVYDPNGRVRVPAANYIVGMAEDAVALDKLDTKWGVNADSFLAKLRSLTELQAFELIVRLDCAWRNHERVEDDVQWIATAFARPVLSAADLDILGGLGQGIAISRTSS